LPAILGFHLPIMAFRWGKYQAAGIRIVILLSKTHNDDKEAHAGCIFF
jgi:hypothetical protein